MANLLLRPGMHVLLGLFLLATRIASGELRERESVCFHGRNFPFHIDFDSVSSYIIQVEVPKTRLYLQYYISYHCAICMERGKGLQTRKVVVSKLPRGIFAVIQIVNMLAGDIELNPGPAKRGRKPKYPCTLCNYAVKNDDKGMLCTSCNKWSRNSCTGVTDQSYEYHKENSSAIWFCPACDLMNIAVSDTTLDSESYHSANQFRVLDLDLNDDLVNQGAQESNPVATSSPKRTLKQRELKKKQLVTDRSTNKSDSTNKAKSTDRKQTKSLGKNSIKIAIANFQSIRNKVTELNAFNTVTNPDIILGSESWLDESIGSAEIFPSNLQTIRNDRVVKIG